jgi:hypothetical protein
MPGAEQCTPSSSGNLHIMPLIANRHGFRRRNRTGNYGNLQSSSFKTVDSRILVSRGTQEQRYTSSCSNLLCNEAVNFDVQSGTEAKVAPRTWPPSLELKRAAAVHHDAKTDSNDGFPYQHNEIFLPVASAIKKSLPYF